MTVVPNPAGHAALLTGTALANSGKRALVLVYGSLQSKAEFEAALADVPKTAWRTANPLKLEPVRLIGYARDWTATDAMTLSASSGPRYYVDRLARTIFRGYWASLTCVPRKPERRLGEPEPAPHGMIAMIAEVEPAELEVLGCRERDYGLMCLKHNDLKKLNGEPFFGEQEAIAVPMMFVSLPGPRRLFGELMTQIRAGKSPVKALRLRLGYLKNTKSGFGLIENEDAREGALADVDAAAKPLLEGLKLGSNHVLVQHLDGDPGKQADYVATTRALALEEDRSYGERLQSDEEFFRTQLSRNSLGDHLQYIARHLPIAGVTSDEMMPIHAALEAERVSPAASRAPTLGALS